MLELHCHTTYSDGTLTPLQLVKAAKQAGVKALAITDHDTLAGWDEAIAAAGNDLEIVPGVELSTVHNGRSLHILGFYPRRADLQGPLQERQAGRRRRGERMLEKLTELGYPLELPRFSDGAVPGRPHVANALVRAGHVKSSEEAFRRFLREGGPAYVEYEKFSTVDGIQLLRDCGAVAVWAHPYLFKGGTVETVLPDLVAAGLMGLEVLHPNHSPSQIRKLEEYCADLNLLKTGGSDYHGPQPDAKGNHASQLNTLGVPLAWLESVKQAFNGAGSTACMEACP
jgi:3',5'-nucleoside bisphosphate phosphatase